MISCVDTREARKVLAESFTRALSNTCYWLDLGNNAASGQYVLGQPLNGRNRRKAERLRTVSELFPEIVDADSGEDTLPSCSAVEALDRQEPFINQTLNERACDVGATVSSWQAQLSWRILQREDRTDERAASRSRVVVQDQTALAEGRSVVPRDWLKTAYM